MTNDRELMQQALEALENHATQRTFAGGVYIANAAIALRERLAQPEPKLALEALEALESTGLFLHHLWCDVSMNDYSFNKLNKQMEVVDAQIAALREALAEQPAQQQEPDIYPDEAYEMGLERIAYYTSPPASRPWVGLTDEDKVEILRANGEAAVLILTEAKLREKNRCR